VNRQEVAELEKPTETVTQFQAKVPALIFFLEPGRDLQDLVLQGRLGERDDELEDFDASVKRVDQVLPARRGLAGPLGKAVFDGPNRACGASAPVKEEGHQTEEGKGRSDCGSRAFHGVGFLDHLFHLFVDVADQLFSRRNACGKLVSERIGVIIDGESRGQQAVLEGHGAPDALGEQELALFDQVAVSPLPVELPGKEPEYLGRLLGTDRYLLLRVSLMLCQLLEVPAPELHQQRARFALAERVGHDELFPKGAPGDNCYNRLVMFRIGAVTIEPPLILAPVAGHTDTLFRQAIKSLGGCGLVVSELVSTEALTRHQEQSMHLVRVHEAERPVSIQIFGSDPARMAASAEIVQEMGADIVDINVGCPVKKVVKQGGGSSLLRDLPLLETVFKEVRRATRVPLTVKIRSGWDRQSVNALEVLKLAEDCGVDALTIHGRTRSDLFKGPADWSIIAQVKAAARIPIIGNGDVFSPGDAERMFRQTGVDGVMIGRGALADPWLIRECCDHLAGRQASSPTLEMKGSFMKGFLGRIAREAPAPEGLGRMKRAGGYLTKGLPGGAHLRERIHAARSCGELLEVVSAFFDARRKSPEAGPATAGALIPSAS